MFLSALSRRCTLRELPVSRITAALSGTPLPVRRIERLHDEQAAGKRRTFSVRKNSRLWWHVPGLSSRCLSSSEQPSLGELIYTGNLSTAVRGVKTFSYSTSGASLLLMPHILLNTGLGAQSWALQVVFCGVIGFFTFLTPVMLHLITKSYVVRLYHNPAQDMYTAVTYSVLLTEKRTMFHQTAVRLPDASKMFTTFYADKMGLLVNPDLFALPQHYNHLMGYDKPFSFCPDQLDRS